MTDPAASPAPPARPAGRGLKVALAVSVALNLLVAGLLAGIWLRGPAPREVGFGPFAEALTEADRRALRRAFLDRAPDLRETRRAQAAAMAELVAALRAEPFDPMRLEAAMSGAAGLMAERLRLGQELLVARIAAMSPADRAAFADRLESVLRRGPRGGDRGEGPPPGP